MASATGLFQFTHEIYTGQRSVFRTSPSTLTQSKAYYPQLPRETPRLHFGSFERIMPSTAATRIKRETRTRLRRICESAQKLKRKDKAQRLLKHAEQLNLSQNTKGSLKTTQSRVIASGFVFEQQASAKRAQLGEQGQLLFQCIYW